MPKTKEVTLEVQECAEEPRLTLKQLAAKHNMYAPRAIDGCEFKAPHAAASAMHGWRRYEYHYGDFMLSDADYLAALEAAAANSVHLPAVAPQKI